MRDSRCRMGAKIGDAFQAPGNDLPQPTNLALRRRQRFLALLQLLIEFGLGRFDRIAITLLDFHVF
jgi:hypothetical protein